MIATGGPALPADLPTLSFAIVGVSPQPAAAAPALDFRLRVTAGPADRVRAILLSVQVRIEAPRRRYTAEERADLRELFGWPEQWPTSLRSLFWTNAMTVVPAFDGQTDVDLVLPLTYDLEVVAAKYLAALDDGEAPLGFLFSGTCFVDTEAGMQATRISWEQEASFGLPVAVWRAAMDAAFPNAAWIRLGRDTFDELWRRRTEAGLATWDQLLADLLAERPTTGAAR
jgi:hypothetical protein